METLMTYVMPIINIGSMIVTGVVILATVAVRLTPTQADDKTVKSISDVVLKALKYFPTIGVNPRTKKLEETLISLSGGSEKTEETKENKVAK